LNPRFKILILPIITEIPSDFHIDFYNGNEPLDIWVLGVLSFDMKNIYTCAVGLEQCIIASQLSREPQGTAQRSAPPCPTNLLQTKSRYSPPSLQGDAATQQVPECVA